MKAPKKIWINPSIDLPKLNGHIDKNSIEYIRKDTFIEKAKEWFNSKNGIVITDTKALFEEFIDYLEVKEVYLEKEFDKYTKNILACDVQFEPFTHLYNCAKHFFELGLTQKGE